MTTKTQRQKPNQMTNQNAYGNQIHDAIHHAIKPLDRIANRMELKWGCERLPELITPETAKRFGSAKAKLDQAIIDSDPDAVAKRAAVLIKGWNAMDQEAEQHHKPLSPQIWSHTTAQGFKFAVAQGNADAIKAIRADPSMEGVAVYSLDEIGRVIESDSMALVNSIKETFPGATVINVSMSELNDELPF